MKISRRKSVLKRRKKRLTPTKAKRLYIKWMKDNEPFLYRVGIKKAQLKNQSLSGTMGAINWSGIFTNIGETVKQLAPAALQYKQQRKLLDVQVKRAEQGLPPLDVQDYAPAVRIEPQINEETEQAITRVAQQSVKTGAKQLMVPLAIGAALLVFVAVRRRGR